MIWCAPHAVARGARCFEQRRPYLIVDGDGRLVTTPNVFHSLCFMCPEARRIMADIAAGLIENWDVDGVKYDLFNCVPNVRCENPDHRHDVSSMVEGLERTLEAMDERTRALKPGYIVELKQNYGTPFLTRYGSMTRAGDTPYSPEANYLRTAHVQGYTPFSINDYQTVTNADAPEDAACVVIKMLAAGIPTYSIDFRRLGEANKAVIAHYNRWYNERIAAFMHHRLPLDGECNRWRVEAPEEDYVFLVNQGGKVPVRRSTTVLNGTYERDLVLVTDTPVQAEITLLDARGTVAARQHTSLSGRQVIDALPGGMVLIKRVDGT
jgi:hypothetical protein